ncbi:MAG: glycosyltransferase [Candidatus Aminicenantes bacterium]
MNKKISCCVGVMAFNEEVNMRFILEALLKQRLSSCEINEIVVVASGCTDQTERIVKTMAASNKLVKLAVQDRREGKASAINLFLSRAKGDVAVIESGDTIPEASAVENLVRPFHDPTVGMTGGRPVPVDSKDSFMGFTVNLFWRLHHEMALNHPKLGELIAFRNIVRKIPEDTAVDEASIEAVITKAGYRIHYAEEAVVFNKGAETISDFLKQRRRVMVGHKHLQKTHDYTVSSMKIRNLFSLYHQLFEDTPRSLKTFLWTSGAVFLEIFGRFLGDYDYYIKRKNPFAWEVAESTKEIRR